MSLIIFSLVLNFDKWIVGTDTVGPKTSRQNPSRQPEILRLLQVRNLSAEQESDEYMLH